MRRYSHAQSIAGASLVEVILAIALFGLFATALIGLLTGSYQGGLQAAQRDTATTYAQQGIEAVRSIRRMSWNLLENGSHGVQLGAGGYWEFAGRTDSL